uniref:Uncharacterized protein n=1 Tax=Hanusia phi TaxID=3032 RepID=A0A7S0HE90_9CRYP|mmetsp:Transcript_14923/g.34371  ORF Transcript_14923/g.34371 Transcript_14923/m.34371 type:complete len:502 (+) Transcript_14923:173-1678(+)
MPSTTISSPRTWLPPLTSKSQQLILNKTFKGDPADGSVFGGTVKLQKLSEDEKEELDKFFVDRFYRLQDRGSRMIILGCKFESSKGEGRLRTAFEPDGSSSSEITTVSIQRVLSLVHDAEGDRDSLGSGEIFRRRVELLAECCGWSELKQMTLKELAQAVELYFESFQEVLLGRPMLEGATAMVMTGSERAPLTPQLLLANHKRKEVESWRNKKRTEARRKQGEIDALAKSIAEEDAVTAELIVSPKAWTRKGQLEIAEMKRATRLKEADKERKEEELAAISKDAEMDVKSVLEDMWRTAEEETRRDYELEFGALNDSYIEPRVGQRVRQTALFLHHLRRKGGLDKSLAPGSCESLKKTSSRWFGNKTFQDGNFPDIPVGILADHGGVGTVKMVHREGDRVLVSWDRTGKMGWYSTGYMCRYHLAICDQDEGVGTTGCTEGLTSLRLMTNRVDMHFTEAARRTEMRRQQALGASRVLPDTQKEGLKHIGKDYDRMNGTGYL